MLGESCINILIVEDVYTCNYLLKMSLHIHLKLSLILMECMTDGEVQ